MSVQQPDCGMLQLQKQWQSSSKNLCSTMSICWLFMVSEVFHHSMDVHISPCSRSETHRNSTWFSDSLRHAANRGAGAKRIIYPPLVEWEASSNRKPAMWIQGPSLASPRFYRHNSPVSLWSPDRLGYIIYWCVLRREFLGMIHFITSNFIIPATPSNPSIPCV